MLKTNHVSDTLTIASLDVLSVEVTSICNFKCKMCVQTGNGTRSSLKPGHISTEIWEEVLKVARTIGFINLNGCGENFVNPKFVDLMRDLDRMDVRMSFSTNGSYLTPSIVSQLVGIKNLFHINVSIESPDPVIFKEIRGISLMKVVSGLKNLVEGMDEDMYITVSSVVMQDNVKSLIDMPTLLSEIGVKNYVLQGQVILEKDEMENPTDGISKLVSYVEKVQSECKRLGISVMLVPYLTHQIKKEEPRIWSGRMPKELKRLQSETKITGEKTRLCSSPWEHIFVNKDGQVLPCCNCHEWEHLNGENQGVMGSLREKSFEDIWNGEKFTRFREQLLKGPTPSVCNTCTVTSPGFHFFNYFQAKINFEGSWTDGTYVNLKVKNIGEAAWIHRNHFTDLRIGSTNSRNRKSALFHAATWQNPMRITTFLEKRIEPGYYGHFFFQITPPVSILGHEVFQLVVDEVCWLSNTKFEMTIELNEKGDPNAKLSPWSGYQES